MFSTIFGKYLQDNKITAYKVAKETGISQGLISDYKNGTKKPSAENLVKIADCLNCSIDYLLGRIGTDEQEIKIITAYRSVNDEGKARIIEQVEYYSNNPKYKKYTDIPKNA